MIPPRIAGACALLAPVIAFGAIAASVWLSPWFDAVKHPLSDLGGVPGHADIWGSRGAAGVIFNGGLVAAGSLGLVLAVYLSRIVGGSRPGRAGAWLLGADVLALAAVGALPETTGAAHTVASYVFFLLMPFALVPLGLAFRASGKWPLGLTAAVLGAATFPALLAIAAAYGGINALAELVPSLILGGFSLASGVAILHGGLLESSA